MTIKPVIELKNIKHTAWASEETHCYQATLYVDGVKWGTVSNQGHGGCDTFDGVEGYDYDTLAELNGRIRDTYEPYTFGDGNDEVMLGAVPRSINQDLDMVCADLVNQWLRDKDFNRAIKSKVLFTKPDVRGVWQLGFKKPKTLWMMLDVMKAKYPQYTYLADLPVDQAKEIYFA
jgi:hypothetical protein